MVDPADMERLLWRVAGDPRPIRIIEVLLDRKAKAMTASAATEWGEVNKQLAPDARSTWFAVTTR